MSHSKKEHHLQIGDRAIPLILRTHKRARRMTLRYHALSGQATLTLPRHVCLAEALRFAEHHKTWLERQIKNSSIGVPFAEGSVLPVLGKEYRITPAPGQREVVHIDDGVLHIGGDVTHLARRLRDWLKRRAREALAEKAREKTKLLGIGPLKVSVRDTRSRWGSCSSKGHLSFSWRLIFAPPDVLDYMVCHEVAHVKEMNHSPKFWETVERLCPDWQASEQWLKTHGSELYRYG